MKGVVISIKRLLFIKGYILIPLALIIVNLADRLFLYPYFISKGLFIKQISFMVGTLISLILAYMIFYYLYCYRRDTYNTIKHNKYLYLMLITCYIITAYIPLPFLNLNFDLKTSLISANIVFCILWFIVHISITKNLSE